MKSYPELHKCLISLETEDLSQEEQVRRIKEPMNSLPPAHFHTLKYMCQHLARWESSLSHRFAFY